MTSRQKRMIWTRSIERLVLRNVPSKLLQRDAVRSENGVFTSSSEWVDVESSKCAIFACKSLSFFAALANFSSSDFGNNKDETLESSTVETVMARGVGMYMEG